MSKVKWAAGAAMVACTGALVACQAGPSASSPAAPTATPSLPPSIAPSSTPVATPPSDRTSVPPAQMSTPGRTDPILSGKRQVSIVRTQAFESGLSLTDDGQLAEVDGDSGRHLFVLAPLGGGSYLIRTAERGSGGEPSCWQAKANGRDPLTVAGAACSASDPRQQFTITRRGQSDGRPTYAIADGGAFLQYSSRRGLILEELGDATLTTTFRFVDNGAAPAYGE